MTKEKNTNIFTPRRTVSYFILTFVSISIAAMIIWPLLDILFSKIENNEYTWNWISGILQPWIFGLVFTIIEFICWNFFHRQK
ncbi:MAG: hypothetical protein Q4A36_03350 [Candidatus Saccharibacteria bacterium]|nr:hypothetical protein [Candidatus Saccharibacteria bacterium]